MWEAIKQIILLGTDQQNFTPEQLVLLDRFGLDAEKAKPLLVLDALSLWEKMKSVGVEPEKWAGASLSKLALNEKTISKALAHKIGLAFKYHEFYKIIPNVMSQLTLYGIPFPAEYIPSVLSLGLENLSFLKACENYFDERFYWLADKNKNWSFIGLKANKENFAQAKKVNEKLFILDKWLLKDPEEALLFLNSQEFASDSFTKEMLLLILEYKNYGEAQLLAKKIKSLKNKLSFGLACSILCHSPDESFKNELINHIAEIIKVDEQEVNIIEENIAATRKFIPKSMLPFKHLESYNNEFDKNLLFHAIAICPPQELFDNHFKMSVDDFVNTVTHLGFYDQVIIQALIYSAASFEHKELLNALIKLFRLGTYDNLVWAPILRLLNTDQLTTEINALLKDGEFDDLCLQIVMEENFQWGPKATQSFLDYLKDTIHHSYFNSKNPLIDVFKNLCLNCHPDFYRYINEQFISNNILSFQLHKIFKKYVNMLKLRYQIGENLAPFKSAV